MLMISVKQVSNNLPIKKKCIITSFRTFNYCKLSYCAVHVVCNVSLILLPSLIIINSVIYFLFSSSLMFIMRYKRKKILSK